MIRIDRSAHGHNMVIQPRYSFTGNLKSIMFNCNTCDPDGIQAKFVEIPDGDVDLAVEEAMKLGDKHVKAVEVT